MRRHRYDWRVFDRPTALGLARAETLDPGAVSDPYRALSTWVGRPDDAFLKRRKDDLASLWLPRYAGASAIVDELRQAGVGGGGRPRTPLGFARYVAACRNTKRVREILLRALLRFGDVGSAAAERGEVTSFALLDPSTAAVDERTPQAHQLAAWQELSGHLAESETTGTFAGLAVMPTGAGKGFTAARWLAEQILSRGLRVVWIAHRHELLEQAAREIYRAAAYVSGVERLRVRLVSSRHCRAHQIDPTDHVVIASIGSLARHTPAVDSLLRDPRVFVVIDEAHHATAKTYRRVLQAVTSSNPSRVLGLTATPTRTAENERPILSRLFGGRVLYQIDLRRLVERGILARPRLVRVDTGVDVESGATDDDHAHLRQFGDLSPDWLARIAAIAHRNESIVDHYLTNRARYGPTVVFAVSVAHAALLAEQLRGRGVRADYVASYRPDGTAAENPDLIRAFRDGQLDVLVNVEMLTEGVDVPGARTVFLTRPTKSEILMRQMVGRALRGPAAGGGEEAFLVAFEDQWERFRDWEHPFSLVQDLVELSEPSDDASSGGSGAGEALPWRVIQDLLRELRLRSVGHPADVFEGVPAGLYVLEGDGDATAIPVYRHQVSAWHGLIQALYGDLERADPLQLYAEWFWSCREPQPSMADVELAVAHWRAGRPRPRYVSLDDREHCDPRLIARRICDEDLGERARVELIEARYSTLARVAYPDVRQYAEAVDDALRELRFGSGA